VRFVNNTVRGGGIEGVDAVEVTLAHNTIVTGEIGATATFRGKYDSLRIESNRIIVPGVQRPAVRVAERKGFTSSGVWIVDNHIETPGDGIFITSPGSHFEIRGNRIFGAGGNFFGIVVGLASATAGIHRDFKILGNTVAEFTKAGIQLSTFNTSEHFEGVAVEDNEIYVTGPVPSTAAAIHFPKPGGGTDRWLVHALVTGNRISNNFQLKIDRHRPTVPFVAVSGNPGSRAVFVTVRPKPLWQHRLEVCLCGSTKQQRRLCI
jgi:Right handed beta helix region